ncbi:MAG: hypothetical protein O3A95_01740 [Planctomycetota bacterium]|nr:hypothetical protein [Planctomycetota bacterium]MDA1113005.1 hypothetical protein [Planctomycetota bacterium]
MEAGYQRVDGDGFRPPGEMIVTSLALLFALQGQPPAMQALASTSADSRLPQDTICRDEAILRRSDSDVWSRVFAPQQTWMSHLGDMDGDGLFDLPDGIDALSYQPNIAGNAPGIFDLVFSSDRDFQGFADGDILRLSRFGGIEIVNSEGALNSALLPVSGSLDIDGLAIVSDNVYLVTFKDSLNGTVVGDVLDGDILRWDVTTQTITRFADEAQVQAWVDHATGSTTSIGDVKSLSFHPVSGDLLFTVQSPSAVDATVFSASQQGEILIGWEEGDWDFQISTEIDALCMIPEELEQPIILSADVNYLHPGEPFQLRMRHATPGVRLSGMAGPNYQIVDSTLGGVGYTVMDFNSRPLHRWPAQSANQLYADASGTADFQTQAPNLPVGMLSATLWYQVYAHGEGWSTPLVFLVE